MDQSDVIVTHNIIKAKIRNRKWTPTHPRAKTTYGERRKPKDVETTWPYQVQIAYAKLRTGHSKDLKAYRHRLNIDDNPLCPCDSGEDETIEHVICRCPRLESRRRMLGQVDTSLMVEDPETARSWLSLLYDSVKIKEPDKDAGQQVEATQPSSATH